MGCSKQLLDKEMKMLMLFNTREKAEKDAYNFGFEGLHQMGDKWMPCIMHKHNYYKKRVSSLQKEIEC